MGGVCLCQTADKFRHYDELPFWEQPDEDEWSSVRGLNFSWGSVDARYARHQVPAVKAVKSLLLEGWRGERVFAQAVIWTKTAAEISFSLSDLSGRGGSIIPASSCEAGFVRYTKTEKLPVITDGCYHGYAAEAAWQYDSTMVADCIDPFMEKDHMPSMSARAVWITVPVPSTDYVGDYRGHLDIFSGGRKAGSLTLTVRANRRILPPPSEWHYHLDLWQNVFSIARDYGVKPFSEEFYTIVRPYLQRLASAGQKAITAPILHAPWGENPGSAGNFLSLIAWVKRLNGEWEFDYTVFDRYIRFAMDCGIDGQISCYTLAPWSYSYRYFDVASGSYKNMVLRPESMDCERILTTFIKDFAAHLREKGWFEKAAIAFDERTSELAWRIHPVGLGPDVIVGVFVFLLFLRLHEPRMVDGGVTDDVVEDDVHAPLVCLFKQLACIVVGAIARRYLVIIADVVARIQEWRIEEGIEPDGIDTETLHIIEFADDALQIAYAVAI